MGFIARQRYIRYGQNRKKDAKWREQNRQGRRRNHAKYREQDNAGFRQHYQENKEYHHYKNKQHYKKYGHLWKERRREIMDEWLFNKCSPSFVERCFDSLGASLRPDRELTFAQCCALIEAMGYKLDDVSYPPFINRRKFWDKKAKSQGNQTA